MARVRFTSHIKQWTSQTESKLDLAVLEIATDIHRLASIKAPKDSRALVKSGKVTRKGKAHYAVRFGSPQVRYAAAQEAGQMTVKEGRIIPFGTGDNVEFRYLKPGVYKFKNGAKGFLENSGEATSRNVKRYLKGLL